MVRARSWRWTFPYLLLACQQMPVSSQRTRCIQLFPDCTGSFCGPRLLNSNNIDKVDDPAEVVILVLLAGQTVYLNRHGRVRLPLERLS